MGVSKTEFCRRAAKDNFPIFEPYYKLTQKTKRYAMAWFTMRKQPNIKEKICIDSFFQMVKENQYKIQYRVMLSRYRGKSSVQTVMEPKLKKEATWVKINGMSINDLVETPITNLKEWFDN